MPLQLLDACVEVLLYEVCATVLVILKHDALQSSLRECEFTHLLLCIFAYIQQELVVAVVHELLAHTISDGCAESLLVLDACLFAVNALEEFLVNLSLNEA